MFLSLLPYIVAACKLEKARVPAFKQAFQTWQKVEGVRDIVAVDWGSEVGGARGSASETLRFQSAQFQSLIIVKMITVLFNPNLTFRA